MKFRAAIAVGALALTACIGLPLTLPTEGALRRSVERVVERHDAYVQQDISLGVAGQLYLQESSFALSLVQLEQVSPAQLEAALDPVMDRHDAYVYKDLTIDQLEAATYLATTEALRRLLDAAIPDAP